MTNDGLESSRETIAPHSVIQSVARKRVAKDPSLCLFAIAEKQKA